MRRKLFSAALVAIAMTACTSEEDLQVNHSQVSPIKFTVTMDEDGSTRADWGGSNGYTLLWEEGDLMSLFHGAEEGTLASMEDAIYKAAAGNSDRSLEFTTQSMVKEGQAIMVYPADTTFAYLDGGLTVSIPTVQSSTNVLERIPFMSEGIKINPYNGDKNSGAGYGKNYEIKLKQVATQLTLNTVWTGTAKDKIEALVADGTIAPITLENVVLNQPTNKFNTKLKIQLEDKGKLGTNWPDEEDGAYDAWNKLSSVDYSVGNIVEKSETLTSSAAVKDGAAGLDKVEFILLPQDNWLGLEDKASVVINTYYGSVTINKEDGKAMYALKDNKPVPEDKYTVANGLNEIISKTTVKKSNETSTFFGEQVGAHATRYIDADLATLDMSTVHIKTDKQLHDILAVYGAIKDGESVMLTIDGTNGKFSLSMDNVKTLLTEEYKNVKLVPCTVNSEECLVIELTQSAGQTTDEVPELTFIADNKVNVWLGENANWTWTGGKKTFNDLVKMVSNHGTLDVAANAVIADATDTKIRMQNKGIININAGVVKQELELHNYGEINIAENAEYRANEVIIYNWGAGVEFEKQGKVYNSGIFAVNNTSGTINNFGGYIENMIGGTENMTYITANETTGADFAHPWERDNQFGTIMLKNADDNISVSNSTAKGFIKYTYTEETYVTPAVCKYNYVIVNNHDITFNEGSYKEIKFLEMVSEGNNIPVITQANNYLPELRGFIVNGKANLKENNKMVVPAAYIKGTFYYGGLFCIDKQPNILPEMKGVYYGNSSDDCLVQYK